VTELCFLNLTLIAHLLRFLVLCFRAKGSLTAENLFLRNNSGSIRSADQVPPNFPSSPLDPSLAQRLVRLEKGVDARNAENLHRLTP
jgi:hypothetical protein